MDEGYKQLGHAILKQAIKDYFKETLPIKQKILRDLRSEWMDWVTNGLSLIAAKELEKNPSKIYRKLIKCEQEETIYEQAN